jgi:hypothetical protein
MYAATAAVGRALVEGEGPVGGGVAMDGDTAAPVRDIEAGDNISRGSGEEERAKADSFAAVRLMEREWRTGAVFAHPRTRAAADAHEPDLRHRVLSSCVALRVFCATLCAWSHMIYV